MSYHHINTTQEDHLSPVTTENIGTDAIFNFSRDFMFYSLAFLIPAGLICNTLSMLVFMARRLRNRAPSWYLSALAFSDNLSLATLMIDYWIKDPRIGWNFIQTSHVLCISVTYLSYTSRLLSAWLVMTFTIERFVGVVFPLKRAALSTTSHARKVIILQTVACLMLTSFTLFTIGLVKNPYGTDCDVRQEMSHLYLVFNIAFVIFGSIVLPVLIICTLNMFILSKVYQRRRHFVPRNMRFNGLRQLSYKSRRDYNIASVLLLVSSTFVILNVPYCICWFVLIFDHFKLIGPFGPNVKWQLYAAKYITSVPYYLNFSINFLLYSLGAQAFRAQLWRLLTCYACRVTKSHFGLETAEGNACMERLHMTCSFYSHRTPVTYSKHSDSSSRSKSRLRSSSNHHDFQVAPQRNEDVYVLHGSSGDALSWDNPNKESVLA